MPASCIPLGVRETIGANGDYIVSMILCAFAFLFAPPLIKVEVPVDHVRASKVAAALNGQIWVGAHQEPRKGGAPLLPSGIRMLVNDARGVLTFLGTDEDDIDQATRTAELLDVEPKHVRVQVGLESKVDRYKTDSTIESLNNEGWSLSTEVGLTLQIASRINEDGTIMVYVKIVGPTGTASCGWREKSGEVATLTIDGLGGIGSMRLATSLANPPPSELKIQGRFEDPITVIIRPKIVEKPA